MILTVTLNAALDVTYRLPRLLHGEAHRVSAVDTRAGGKGINVARVLAALGVPVLVGGFAGGRTGAAVRAELASAGLAQALVEIEGESRTTVAVVSTTDGAATVFNEQGPPVGAAEWERFVGVFRELVAGAELVVLSGSLPPGLPVDAYARLLRLAGDVPAILDTSGDALLAGLAGRPAVIKPNAVELSEATGVGEPLPAAGLLRERGAGSVVASLGADGLVALTPDGVWRATPAEQVHGNPTGAGDACVAAIAAGLALGRPWPELLAEAVAVSAAAVAAPAAGDFDRDTYHRLRPTVHVREHHADADR